MFYIMAQYIISSRSIRVRNFSGSWKYTTFLIAHKYNRVNFITPVINIVFYACNVWLYCSKPLLNHITIWTNVTSTPLKLCIQLPSGVVDPLSLYQTQRFNRLSNLLMALLMFIYFYTSLITIAHVWQLLYLIYIGQSFSHKHDIISVYMYHVCSQGGLVEYFHCNNSIKCYYIFMAERLFCLDQCKTCLYTFSIFITISSIMYMCGQKWLMSLNCINNYSVTSYLWHVGLQLVVKYTCKSIECLYVCLKFSTYVYVICNLLIMCRGDFLITKSFMHSIRNHGNKVVSNVITLKININFIGVLLSQIYLTYLIEIFKKTYQILYLCEYFFRQEMSSVLLHGNSIACTWLMIVIKRNER